MEESEENAMRVVVKVGTSTLAHPSGCLNIRQVEKMCKVLSDLKNAGHEVILVSSGAIAMGMGKLPLLERPKDMPTKQATAAVGQCELMYIYDKLFSEYNHVVAQLLVTGEDLEHEDRCQNIQNTLFRLLELKVLPIVNENDTIATQEIAVGDNDTLSAIVAVRMKAELLVILSDIDGLYTANPKEDSGARLIPVVWELDEKIEKLAGEGCGPLGTGGMVTKLHAAQLATAQGTDVVIANGQSPELLYDILDGAAVGTRFIGRRTE